MLKHAITPKLTAALAALLSLGVLGAGALTPATAADPMLEESEPNDTVLEADGPVPAAGYLSTRSTSNDIDRFIVRLQPQRQVTMTVQRVANCYSSTDFLLTRSDGYEQINFGNLFDSTYTKAWTTPAVPVEYIGKFSHDYHATKGQCTTSVVFTPADAVIVEPLPAPAPRNAIISPVDAVENTDFTVTVSGNAYANDTLYTWADSATSTCTKPTGTQTLVPAGPFSVPVTVTGREAGPMKVCAVVRNSSYTLITDAVAGLPVAVRAVNPMTVETRKVKLSKKRTAKMAVKCLLPSGETCTANLSIATKSGKAVGTATASVAAGATGTVSFKVSRKIARQAEKSGVLRLNVTGTVIRTGLAVIPIQKARLLLVPKPKKK